MYKDPDKRRAWHAEYDKTAYKKYRLRLKVEEDKDLIEHLSTKDSINAYIKALIVEDMKRG